MPILLKKYTLNQRQQILRDVRPVSVRMAEYWGTTDMVGYIMATFAILFLVMPAYAAYADIGMLVLWRYFKWAKNRPFCLPFKFPRCANLPDEHNPPPGKTGKGKSEGIMFIGNIADKGDDDYGRELWLSNTDVRTHILYLGTTGSGKTEGLKSMVTNALSWGSGFVYVDGKADTDLWASLFALARRFGRDDDLLILNYMTANSDDGAVSNTMNPFSNGSSSYLSNMVVNLMPDAGGDNAMWKERAVALLSALMPALTWKRDKQGLLLDVGVLREFIELRPIIALSRDANLPERIVRGLQGYLNTLPGFVDAAFDDEGNERPPSPDQPMYDLQVARQQHGYLSMQFTRALQSLADEYGYIFKVQLADIDVLDVVLNRRILIALIPALEKSSDEAANLGKIIAACLKGMMGATLGNTVEGSWEMAIGSKQTRSESSFMTIFDEVGYYTANGMAVMAAQARSLGFSLVFAAQDLPSMEKRIKQEAQSILANCNLKIFGKIEDPMETQEFLSKHAGSGWVMEGNGMASPQSTVSSLFFNTPFMDNRSTGGAVTRNRVSYDHLRGQREGEAHMFFADWAVSAKMFYAKPDKVQALRVHKFLPVPGTTTSTAARERAMAELASRLKDPDWTAESAAPLSAGTPDLTTLIEGVSKAREAGRGTQAIAAAALVMLSTVAPVSALSAKSGAAGAPVSKTSSYRAEDDGAPLISAWGQPATMQVRTIPAQTTMPSGGSYAATTTEPEQGPLLTDEQIRERADRRAGLPPLLEGDQYAITELEQFFAESMDAIAAELEPDPALRTSTPSQMDVEGLSPPALPASQEELRAELPEDMAAIVQETATKLNEGLADPDEEKR